jgi:hypothetical protein
MNPIECLQDGKAARRFHIGSRSVAATGNNDDEIILSVERKKNTTDWAPFCAKESPSGPSGFLILKPLGPLGDSLARNGAHLFCFSSFAITSSTLNASPRRHEKHKIAMARATMTDTCAEQ